MTESDETIANLTALTLRLPDGTDRLTVESARDAYQGAQLTIRAMIESAADTDTIIRQLLVETEKLQLEVLRLRRGGSSAPTVTLSSNND